MKAITYLSFNGDREKAARGMMRSPPINAARILSRQGYGKIARGRCERSIRAAYAAGIQIAPWPLKRREPLKPRCHMIREATVDDAKRVAEIHVYGWRYAYRGLISDDYLFSKLSVTKRADHFAKVFEDKAEESYVFDDEGIVKGFMTIGRCRNEDKMDAFELWGIYIEPIFKNGGIGSQMVRFCEEAAIKRGHSENVLWVFKDNLGARAFYERMGYKPDGREEIIGFFNAIEMRYSKEL